MSDVQSDQEYSRAGALRLGAALAASGTALGSLAATAEASTPPRAVELGAARGHAAGRLGGTLPEGSARSDEDDQLRRADGGRRPLRGSPHLRLHVCPAADAGRELVAQQELHPVDVPPAQGRDVPQRPALHGQGRGVDAEAAARPEGRLEHQRAAPDDDVDQEHQDRRRPHDPAEPEGARLRPAAAARRLRRVRPARRHHRLQQGHRDRAVHAQGVAARHGLVGRAQPEVLGQGPAPARRRQRGQHPRAVDQGAGRDRRASRTSPTSTTTSSR